VSRDTDRIRKTVNATNIYNPSTMATFEIALALSRIADELYAYNRSEFDDDDSDEGEAI
jgi:hypothetical protein